VSSLTHGVSRVSPLSAAMATATHGGHQQPLTAASPLLTQTANTMNTPPASLPSQLPRGYNNHVRQPPPPPPVSAVNSNIRVPRGIPPPPPPRWGIPTTRPSDTAVTSGGSDSTDAIECDTNPLRRLRNVSTFRPMTTSYAQCYK